MKPPSTSIAAVVAITLVVAAGVAASAQSPVHQVELVAGSCDEPGLVLATLADIAPGVDTPGAPAEMDGVAAALGSAVLLGHATVPLSMPDVAASGHAVRVFERYRPPGRLVACGEFDAVPLAVRDLHIGLVATGDSELQGVAWLRDNGDGTIGASIAIAPYAASDAPASDDGSVKVAIRKSLYLPNPLEIEIGTTVDWVNEDVLPHTVTATDGALDSGYMALDGRFSYTFDAAGEYPIFCVYHPRMRAVVIVS